MEVFFPAKGSRFQENTGIYSQYSGPLVECNQIHLDKFVLKYNFYLPSTPLHFCLKYCTFPLHLSASYNYFADYDFSYKTCDHFIKYDSFLSIKQANSM